MTIGKLYGSIPQTNLLQGKDIPSPLEEAKQGQQKGFGDMLTEAIGQVSNLQNEAEGKVQATMTGEANTAPHDLMITLEKADIAFQLMNKVRTNLIRAYEEVMRTQV